MTPIRPVSDEHRHEPADYELEPNELAEELFAIVQCTKHEDDALAFLTNNYDRILTALTQAPRSCWQPIETAPKNWVPVMVWAISEDEREDADDEGRDYVYQAMIARHSDIQPGHWWLCGSSMTRVFDPVLWQPLEPPANQEQQP